MDVVSYGTLGSTVESAEITDGSIVPADLNTLSFPLITSHFMWSWNPTLVSYTTTEINDSNSFTGFYLETSNTQNGEIHYNINARAGTYDLTLLFNDGGDCAIASVYVDDDLQGTIDLYGSSGKNQTDVVSVTLVDGEQTIKLKGATKNGSSTGYVMRLQGFKIE